MKILVLMFLIMFFDNAKAASGFQIWSRADMNGKITVLEEYKNFYKSYSSENVSNNLEVESTSFNFSFMPDAWAASAFNCVYAGWPSKLVGKTCSSPSKHNPDYDQNSCGQSQMQCQPLLFGKGLCVPTSTSQQRSLAFSNCEKKKSKSPADIVREVQSEGKEHALKDFLDFADEICATGKQASTGMCRRLKNSIENLKVSIPEVAPVADMKISPVVVSEGRKIDFFSSEGQSFFKAARLANKINEAVDEKPSAEEDCEEEKKAEVEKIAEAPTSSFERENPRAFSFKHLTFLDPEKNGYDKGFIKTQDDEMIPMGFRIKNHGPNEILPGENTERAWWFTSKDNSKRETYLWLSDENGSGRVSQIQESIIVMIPRKVLPSATVVDDELHVTLPTGEKVIYDNKTKLIKSGVLTEGKQGKAYAPIKYSGTGISIRVNHRGEDPRRISGKAVITQQGVACEVPASSLWFKNSDFKYSDDQQLVDFLNSKCSKKFKI